VNRANILEDPPFRQDTRLFANILRMAGIAVSRGSRKAYAHCKECSSARGITRGQWGSGLQSSGTRVVTIDNMTVWEVVSIIVPFAGGTALPKPVEARWFRRASLPECKFPTISITECNGDVWSGTYCIALCRLQRMQLQKGSLQKM
jgi:hypothetical protein